MIRPTKQLRGSRSPFLLGVVLIALTSFAPGVLCSTSVGKVYRGFLRDAGQVVQHRSVNEDFLQSSHSPLLGTRSGIAPLANQGVRLRPTARRLGASTPMVAQQCSWDPASASCDADDAVNIMYAIHARPGSAYLWFLLMTYDRESACGVHTSASACNGDTTNRCIYFDDILSLIGGGTGSSAANSSSSSSSSSSKNSSNHFDTSSTASNLGPDLAAALLLDSSHSNLGQDKSYLAADLKAVAAPSGQDFRQQLSERLLQQQQSLQELLLQQMTPDRQQLLPQLFTDSAAASASSGTSSGAAPAGSKPRVPARSKPAAKSGSSRDVLCTSTDLLENYLFTKSAFSNPLQAPLAMHCPGSKASDLVNCMRLPGPATCKSHPECVFVPGSANGKRPDTCVSKYFNSLTPDQVKKFTFEATMAEPSVVGACDGACWMRQAMLCNRTSGEGACSALSFCRTTSKGACTPKLYSQDNFGSSVQEYMGECVEVDNKRDCESLRLRLVNKGNYASWQMPKTPVWQCHVPSIGRLLGPDTAQERGSRLIAAAGAMEEQAAELKAAAAAAAAATNAAQLVSGRGPEVLRQIYFQTRQP